MMDYYPLFYVSAELFTENDIQFHNQIRINSIVIETSRAFDPSEYNEMIPSSSEGD